MLRPEPERESGEEGGKSCREIEMGAYQRQAGRSVQGQGWGTFARQGGGRALFFCYYVTHEQVHCTQHYNYVHTLAAFSLS